LPAFSDRVIRPHLNLKDLPLRSVGLCAPVLEPQPPIGGPFASSSSSGDGDSGSGGGALTVVVRSAADVYAHPQTRFEPSEFERRRARAEQAYALKKEQEGKKASAAAAAAAAAASSTVPHNLQGPFAGKKRPREEETKEAKDAKAQLQQQQQFDDDDYTSDGEKIYRLPVFRKTAIPSAIVVLPNLGPQHTSRAQPLR
jgi:hypothetical protein